VATSLHLVKIKTGQKSSIFFRYLTLSKFHQYLNRSSYNMAPMPFLYPKAYLRYDLSNIGPNFRHTLYISVDCVLLFLVEYQNGALGYLLSGKSSETNEMIVIGNAVTLTRCTIFADKIKKILCCQDIRRSV
jgi:hypothetical protein